MSRIRLQAFVWLVVGIMSLPSLSFALHFTSMLHAGEEIALPPDASRAGRQSPMGPLETLLGAGHLQSRVAAFYADNLGQARKFLLKLTEGIYYVAFHRTLFDSTGIVIGKERMLFVRNYIDDACGWGNAIDPASFARQIRAAQEALAKRGIAFVLLISPNKAAVYREFVPSELCLPTGPHGAYAQLLPQLAQSGLPVVDGHAIAVSLRHSQPLPVFDRDGVHWNRLCAFPAVRAVIAAVERQLQRPVGDLVVKGVEVDDTATADDGDLGKLLTLPFNLHPYPTPHANVALAGPGHPVRFLFIGTSFTRMPMSILAQSGLMAASSFYSYYDLVFRVDSGFNLESNGGVLVDSTTGPADLPTTISQVDAVVMEVNEGLLDIAYIQQALRDLANLPPKDK